MDLYLTTDIFMILVFFNLKLLGQVNSLNFHGDAKIVDPSTMDDYLFQTRNATTSK